MILHARWTQAASDKQRSCSSTQRVGRHSDDQNPSLFTIVLFLFVLRVLEVLRAITINLPEFWMFCQEGTASEFSAISAWVSEQRNPSVYISFTIKSAFFVKFKDFHLYSVEFNIEIYMLIIQFVFLGSITPPRISFSIRWSTIKKYAVHLISQVSSQEILS